MLISFSLKDMVIIGLKNAKYLSEQEPIYNWIK